MAEILRRENTGAYLAVLAALELAAKLAACSREHPPRAGESQEP